MKLLCFFFYVLNFYIFLLFIIYFINEVYFVKSFLESEDFNDRNFLFLFWNDLKNKNHGVENFCDFIFEWR